MHEKFPCKSHKYQDRLRIVASRKAIQQANDRRIHHSSDWCQLHLIIWAGCGLGRGVRWEGRPGRGVSPQLGKCKGKVVECSKLTYLAK
jgi:hypothetical protein